MKAKLIYIGKEDSAELTAAVAAYVGKIKFYLPFEMEAIPYLKNKVSQEEQKKTLTVRIVKIVSQFWKNILMITEELSLQFFQFV